MRPEIFCKIIKEKKKSKIYILDLFVKFEYKIGIILLIPIQDN